MSSIRRVVESYGELPLQVGEWFLPTDDAPAPTVVLVHGGFWRENFDRHLEDDVAIDLASRGYLCWNIDYRSAALPWPATLSDVAAGYDHVFNGAYAGRVDHTRVGVVGHSAGGHLVAWLASRHKLPREAPGYNCDLRLPTVCIPQAAVVALTDAAHADLGRGAVSALMNGMPEQHPQRYAVTDPVALLPTGVRTVLLHDRDDAIVPISQSETYVSSAAQRGDDSTLEVVPGTHFSHIKPKSKAVQRLRDVLATM